MWAKALRRNARFLLTGLKTRPYILFMVAGLLVANADAGRVRAPKGYVLVWSDEFKGKNGALPDAKKWTYDIGGSGWGNHELEYYTNRAENARIEHGKLLITARREDFAGPDGKKFDYTSTRLKTQSLFAQAYGRFEARIKLPAGQGFGRRSGCWRKTLLEMAGRNAARSTSWKISAKSRESIMARCTDPAPQIRPAI